MAIALVPQQLESSQFFVEVAWTHAFIQVNGKFESIPQECMDKRITSFTQKSICSAARLIDVQGQLLTQIIKWTQRKFEAQSSHKNNFEKWIRHAAEVTAQFCSGLSTDIIPKGEMKCDYKGWLPLSLAVRTFQTIDQSYEHIVQFFAYFSCYAAKLCIGDVTSNWDSTVERNAEALMEDITEKKSFSSSNVPLKIKCVVTAEVVLDAINRVGEEVTRDGPKFLAAVEIAVNCEQIGITLFNIHTRNIDKSVGVLYETVEEASGMSNHFERLESLCISLKKKVVSVLVDKNMMRVKELLSIAGGIYGDYKSKAKVLSNRRESMFSKNRQSDIGIFLKQRESIDGEDIVQ